MDWPLTGAVAGVTSLAALVAYLAYGAVAEVRTVPQVAKKPPPAPMLWAVRQPDLQVSTAREPPPPLGPSLDWPGVTPPAPTAPAGQVPAGKKAPVRTTAKTVTAPEPRRTAPEKGPVASKPPAAKPTFQVPKVDHRYDGVLTLAEIGRIRSSMRLAPDQQPHWLPVERVLRDIGKQQIAQVNSGRKPEVEASALRTSIGRRDRCSPSCDRIRRSRCASSPARSDTPLTPP